VKTAYIAFEIINNVAHVEQPVRSSDGVEVWEVLPAGRVSFARHDGWYWMRRSYLSDKDMNGFPAAGTAFDGLHGPFESERAARKDMEALGAVRASVHWPTIGDPVRGFVTKPPKEYEVGYVEMIELEKGQWSEVKEVTAA
jgi:hypothetical protein